MVENTTNEGMTNNSNQPSTIEKLEQIINTRISDLNSELDELRSIKVTDEIKKLVVGSTEFNIEDFMSEPDIDRFRNWLKIKKEWENTPEDEIRDMVVEEKDNRWSNEWFDEVYNNFHDMDIDVWDYISERDFISDYMDRDSYDIDWIKDKFFGDQNETEILSDLIKERL